VGWFDFCPITLGDAEIRVLNSGQPRTLRVTFVLTTFRLAKENDFTGVSVPVTGLNGEPLQFLRARARTVSMVLHFDGRETNTDVRQSIDQVMALMRIDPETRAPLVLSFDWLGFSFRCVLEHSMQSFTSFFPDGRPSLGQVYVSFRESLTLEQLLQDANLE
jgi:hypothetical protein